MTAGRGGLERAARAGLIVSMAVTTLAATAFGPGPRPVVTPERIRALDEREWRVKSEKMRAHLLPLMRKHGVDLLVVMSRENAVDPVVSLFGGHGVTGWYGHRNAYLFFDPGGDRPLETTALGTHLSGHLSRFYDTIRNYGEEGLAPHLKRYVDDRRPRRIAVNRSRTISMFDGLTVSLNDYLVDAIGPEHAAKLTSSEPLLVEYASVHTAEEHDIAREASRGTFDILRRAFSNEAITPGRTRLMDLHYWITAERKIQGFEFNFPASLDLQRPDGLSLDDADDPVVERGDLLHVDFGVTLSGIVTDQQKMAYVLKEGETAPPAGLVKAFAESQRAAAIVLEEMKPGRTGIEIKRAAESRASAEGLQVLVYSHVQGYWVHDAGVWMIHDWPERYGDHPRFRLLGGEWISLEFSTTTAVPEWGGQAVRMMREEDVLVHPDGRTEYLSGPQTELWTIR